MTDEAGAQSGVIISIAASDAEREACCALRYRVYVEEQKRPAMLADHARKLDRSADDASGVHFCAHLGGNLVGTLRVHHGGLTEIPPFFREVCGLPQTGPLPAAAVIGRLAVDPAHRGAQTIVMLLRACHEWLNAEGRVTRQVFIAAFDIPGVIAMYRMMGFRPIEPVTSHMSEIGPVVPMVLSVAG